MGLLLLTIVFLILTIQECYALFRHKQQQNELQQSKQVQDIIQEAMPEKLLISGLDEIKPPIVSNKPVILKQYQSLYTENTDFIGWLSIEGTVIDYPVMQYADEYYLDYNFYNQGG